MADSDEIFLALDGYALDIDVQTLQRKPSQVGEARLVFDALVAGLPEVPALLSHNVTMLIAGS